MPSRPLCKAYFVTTPTCFYIGSFGQLPNKHLSFFSSKLTISAIFMHFMWTWSSTMWMACPIFSPAAENSLIIWLIGISGLRVTVSPQEASPCGP